MKETVLFLLITGLSLAWGQQKAQQSFNELVTAHDPDVIDDLKHDVSYVGTEGYMAPEGPGTPTADVYGLGKLLYEISMGRDRREFPELPNTLLGLADEPQWRAFHQILFKACAIRSRNRYQSAGEVRADLLKLKDFLP